MSIFSRWQIASCSVNLYFKNNSFYKDNVGSSTRSFVSQKTSFFTCGCKFYSPIWIQFNGTLYDRMLQHAKEIIFCVAIWMVFLRSKVKVTQYLSIFKENNGPKRGGFFILITWLDNMTENPMFEFFLNTSLEI